MAKPKVSPAIERRYLLVAELRRRSSQAWYGSDDVFWVELAAKERRLLTKLELKKISNKDLVDFYNEVGQAIGNGGIGSGTRFEKARQAVAKANDHSDHGKITQEILDETLAAMYKIANEHDSPSVQEQISKLRATIPVDRVDIENDIEADYRDSHRHLDFFGLWAKTFLKIHRLPTNAEFERICFEHKCRDRILEEFRLMNRREPNAEEWEAYFKKALQDKKHWGFPDRKDFTATCNSLGLEFINGNDRTKLRARIRAAQEKEGLDPKTIDPVELLESDPKLGKYLVENWSIGAFFEWLDDLRRADADLDQTDELRGASAVIEIWDKLFELWLVGLTKDGSITVKSDLPFSQVFQSFCDETSFAPSAIELLIGSNPIELDSLAKNLGCPDASALHELQRQLSVAVSKGKSVYDITVSAVPVVKSAAEAVKVDAAYFSIEGFGIDIHS